MEGSTAETATTIVSEDGHVRLSLTQTEIQLGLSEAMRAEVERKLDEARHDLPGGLIGRFARWAVNFADRATHTDAHVGLSEVRGASVEGGKLRLDYARRGAGSVFDHIQVNNRPALETFSSAEAQRFANAVNQQLGA